MFLDPATIAQQMASIQTKIEQANSLIAQAATEHTALAATVQNAVNTPPTLAQVKAMLDKIPG